MRIMIAHYGICDTLEEFHPHMEYTHHLQLHSLWQILHLNHRNHVCQSRPISLHILQHSLHIFSHVLISLNPLSMSWDSLWVLRTYICMTNKLLLLDTTQTYLCFILFEKKNEIYKNISYQYHRRKNLVERNIWIPSIVYPDIRVVINGYDLSTQPKKEIIIVVGWHPTTS
jgi:hypothetical protein